MIHKIKALYDDGKGLSKRAIARKFGLSRNTVKKCLGMSEKEIESRQADCQWPLVSAFAPLFFSVPALDIIFTRPPNLPHT